MEEQILGISMFSETSGEREPYYVGNFIESIFGMPLNTIIENIDISNDELDKIYNVSFELANDTNIEFSILKNQLIVWSTDNIEAYDNFKKESERNAEEFVEMLEQEARELDLAKQEQARNSIKPNGI